jgi:hypothetical protein
VLSRRTGCKLKGSHSIERVDEAAPLKICMKNAIKWKFLRYAHTPRGLDLCSM